MKMKTYQCDSCKRVIENPYKTEMKEFLYVCDYTVYGVFPKKSKRKVKIHLCDKCFKGLSKLAENRLKEMG